MAGETILEIERPRSAVELIGATLSLYRRFPWLFLTLAAVVVVPYQVLEAIPELGLLHGPAEGWLGFALSVGEMALVVPLVSAFHIFAVEDVRAGREPEIATAARRGIARLRVVSPAVFLSWLGIVLGLAALIVPGIALAARWAVVGQTSSLEAENYSDAFTRSKHLTDDRYRHVLGLLFLVYLITWIPYAALIPIFGLKTTALAPFLIRAVLSVATSSFTALATALLYFDLKARPRIDVRGRMLPPALNPDAVAAQSDPPAVPPTGDPLDPGSWTDEDRPAGWYVDPDSPWRMRHWAADGQGTWSRRTTKTPKATLANWRDLRHVREQEARADGPD